MHKALLVAALSACSLALPEPNPQKIDIDAVKAAPKPQASMIPGLSKQIVKYDRDAIRAAAKSISVKDHVHLPEVDQGHHLAKRTACQLEPPAATGAPAIGNALNIPSDFQAATALKLAALDAVTPQGYTQVFAGLTGAVNSYGYLGYQLFQKYDVAGCAALCSKTAGCQSFNTYFERSPSLEPAAACPNPSPVTLIKCVIWGGPSNLQNAVNNGQFRTNFQVVIAGSNAYMKNNGYQITGYGPAVSLGNSAIDALYDSQGYQDYMGVKIFSYGPFDPQLCADYCTAQSTFNRNNPPRDGSPVQTCQFFNTYLIYKNDATSYQAQYCAIYSETFDASFATNKGFTDGADHYKIDSSYAFSNAADPGSPNKEGAIYQAAALIRTSSLQGFCSTLLGYFPSTKTVTSTTTITPTTTVDTTITQSTTVTVAAARPAKRTQAAAAAGIAPATPPALVRFPATVVSSACSKEATPVTTTDTTTAYSTSTAPTKTITVTRSAFTTITVNPAPTCPAEATGVFTATGPTSSTCVCGYQKTCGKWTDFAKCFLYSQRIPTFDQCLASCDATTNCVAAQYTMGSGYQNGQCYFCPGDSALAQPVKTDNDVNWYFASRQKGSCKNANCKN